MSKQNPTGNLAQEHTSLVNTHEQGKGFMPQREWNKPGDTFKQFSLYRSDVSITISSNIKGFNQNRKA